MPGGAIILIQTRWHEDDLAGWLLQEHASENWDVLSLPAIAEKDESFRREGEPLWPERFPLDSLNRIREAVGGAVWASLYQQRPAAAEGAIFKRNWWQFFAPSVAIPFSRVVQSWDTAFKRGAENDFSVCTTWGVAQNGYYLLHLWRYRVEFPELKRVLAALADQWKPHAILVEDKASGQSLIQELQRSTVLPLIPVRVDADKLTRAQAVTPVIEAGKIFLPESAPWVSDFVEEMAGFPHRMHDDVVDSTTQALNYLREEPQLLPISLGYLTFGPNSVELDKEAIWDKAMRGIPLTAAEFDRL
jgi:predicted phage terminase large subunit-like protein